MEDESDLLSCYSQDDNKTYKLPDSQKVFIEIEVLGTYKSSTGKFTKYTIKGTDHMGSFEVVRRYREFKRLREVLCLNWLGCVVPMLPGKKPFGNLRMDFVEKRKKFLKTFLEKVSKIGYLYLDEYFQYFIRKEESFLLVCKEFCGPSYKNLAKKYKFAFLELSGRDIDDGRVKELESLCKSNLSLLQMHKKSLKQCEKRLEAFEYSHKKVFTHIAIVAKGLLPEKNSEEIVTCTLKNPFIESKFRLNVMIGDLRAMEMSLEKFNSLRKSVDCFINQVSEYSVIIEEIQSGKKPVLTTKSKENLLSNFEKIYCDVKTNLSYLSFIVEKLFLLLNCEFSRIQSEHFYFFAGGLQNYAELCIENYEKTVVDVLALETQLSL